MSGIKTHNKLVDLITLSYELNNINKNDTHNKIIENENENLEEKNLSICLSTSIMEYDNREKNKNLLKETIREITDNFAVIHPLKKLEDYEELNRNYFRLININAPVKKRMENYLKKHKNQRSEEDKLKENKKSDYETFLEADEKYYFENKDIKEMQTFANYHISNDGTLDDLKSKLDILSSTLHQTFRPNWDDYFMKITIAVSERSNCMKQRIGAVIVKDFRIISTGYNGMSSSLGNCYLGNCPRCNIKAKQGENLHNCICIHAEESAVNKLYKFYK
jgi:dCMP deaminase